VPPPIPRTSIERALAFLNTWDTFSADPERIADSAVLGRFMRWVHDRSSPVSVDDRDLARFRRARTELRGAFDAPDEASGVARLNSILASRPVRVRLEPDDGQWTMSHQPVPSDPIEALLTEAALALLSAIGDGGWERFGTCAGSPCTCVYVDRTRNRSRRFCSDLCNDRVSQEAHRRRRSRIEKA